MNAFRKISMALIVAGLSLAATGVFAQDTEGQGQSGKGKRGGRGGKGQMFKNLSEEDRAKLKDVMQSMRKEIQEVMKSDAENKHEKAKEIAEKYGSQIKAIVGEENYKKMQAMRKKHMGQRGGKNGKGRGPGNGMLKNLSEEQREQLKAVHQEMRKEMEALRSKYAGKIKSIVGEENFKKMQAMRKKGMGRRGGRGQGGKRKGNHGSEN